MVLRKNYQFPIVPAGIILIALLSLVVVLPKQIKGLSKEWQEIKRVEKEIEDLKIKHLLVSSLEEETLAEQASLALAALPEDKNVPYILQGLRNSINETGFLIKELKFAPGEIKKEGTGEKKLVKKRVEELPLDLEIVGAFAEISNFFNSLEKVAPLFQSTNLEIVNSGSDKGNSIIKLKLITFYSPPMSVYETKGISLEDLVLSEEERESLGALSQLNLTTIVAREGRDDLKRSSQDPFSF